MVKPLDKLEKLTSTLSKVEANLHSERNILKRIIELSNSGYWDWNILTDYKYLSSQILNTLGYTKNTLDDWTNIYTKSVINNLKTKIDETRSDESFDYVCNLIHRDGRKIPFMCKGLVVSRNKNGKPVRAVGIYQLYNN